MPRIVYIALKEAARSPNKRAKMAAVLLRGGVVVGREHNTHTWNGHCERRVLRPTIDACGATLVIIRDNLRCSKPCPRCMEAIRLAGIKKIGYVDRAGQFVWERVKEVDEQP